MDGFSSLERMFEEALRDGITAAKSGDRRLAQMLLNRALMINSMDARPYIWLSATTDDLAEQRDYLEKAVAVEPSNVTARRGLAILTGKIDPSRLIKEGAPPVRPAPAAEGEEPEAQTESFQCPQCGGRLAFNVQTVALTCEYCGYARSQVQSEQKDQASVADKAEQVLDFVIPTQAGHHWAEGQMHLVCKHCGAHTLLDQGEKAVQCSFCGSNQMVKTDDKSQLIDPQVIILMKTDQATAERRVKDWLGRGFFTPDNLRSLTQRLHLRPAYYSCWTFDGTLEVKWSCEVNEGSGKSAHWVSRSGAETKFFNDVLVAGVKALTARELNSIEPFNVKDVVEFKPEYLAGWPALIYDRSLSDASLVAREKVMKKLRPILHNVIEPGREKRNVNIGGGSWSGMTFKHVLAPVWVGTYRFQQKEYQLLVNGQTGKVGGIKPLDRLKIVFSGLVGVMFIALVVVVYWLLSSPGGIFGK